MELLNYFSYNSVVVLSMFLISFVEIILNSVTGGWLTDTLFSTERASLLNPFTYVRFITHSLGHRDWEHFSNNYMKILLLGPLIEEKYGMINLIIMLVITSVVIALVNFIKGKTNLCGASGICFMLIVLSSVVNISNHKVPLTFVLVIIFYIIDELVNIFKDRKSNISHSSHLIGALCGGAFGYLSLYTNFFNQVINIIK